MPEVTVNKESSSQAIQDWIGQCIRHMRRKEGKDAAQAAGACYNIARKATGKELGYKGK